MTTAAVHPDFTMSLSVATAAAEKVAQALRDSGVCRQVHIAGGVRRGKPQGIHDLDLVVVPEQNQAPDGLHAPTWTPRFVAFLRECDLWREADIAGGEQLMLGGHADSRITHLSRKISLRSAKNPALKIELWCAVPSSVGAALMIRTGPSDFSKLMVAAARYEGVGMDADTVRAIRDGDRTRPRYYFSGGHLRCDDPEKGDTGVVIPTPHEGDVFAALNLRYIQPQDRTEQTLRREINAALRRTREGGQ